MKKSNQKNKPTAKKSNKTMFPAKVFSDLRNYAVDYLGVMQHIESIVSGGERRTAVQMALSGVVPDVSTLIEGLKKLLAKAAKYDLVNARVTVGSYGSKSAQDMSHLDWNGAIIYKKRAIKK